MLNEPRILISDSIREDVDLPSLSSEKRNKIDESQIAVLILLEKNSNNDIVAILRGSEINEELLKLTFICKSVDSIKILMQYFDGNVQQFESAIIDFYGQTNKIDLLTKKMSSFVIKEIDNDKQTANCEIIFTSDR